MLFITVSTNLISVTVYKLLFFSNSKFVNPPPQKRYSFNAKLIYGDDTAAWHAYKM